MYRAPNIAVKGQYGGDVCPEPEERVCNTDDCPVDWYTEQLRAYACLCVSECARGGVCVVLRVCGLILVWSILVCSASIYPFG